MTGFGTIVRRGTAPLFLALCALLVMGGTASAAAMPYTDPIARFSFTMPDGWQAQNTNDTGDFLFTDAADNATFDVAVEPKPDEGTLADITQALVGVDSLTPQYQADAAGVQDVMIGGVPAKTFAFTAQGDGGVSVTTRVYLLIHKNASLYQFTLIAPPNTAPNAAMATQALLASWMFA